MNGREDVGNFIEQIFSLAHAEGRREGAEIILEKLLKETKLTQHPTDYPPGIDEKKMVSSWNYGMERLLDTARSAAKEGGEV